MFGKIICCNCLKAHDDETAIESVPKHLGKLTPLLQKSSKSASGTAPSSSQSDLHGLERPILKLSQPLPEKSRQDRLKPGALFAPPKAQLSVQLEALADQVLSIIGNKGGFNTNSSKASQRIDQELENPQGLPLVGATYGPDPLDFMKDASQIVTSDWSVIPGGADIKEINLANLVHLMDILLDKSKDKAAMRNFIADLFDHNWADFTCDTPSTAAVLICLHKADRLGDEQLDKIFRNYVRAGHQSNFPKEAKVLKSLLQRAGYDKTLEPKFDIVRVSGWGRLSEYMQ